jgi:hypothetical protein
LFAIISQFFAQSCDEEYDCSEYEDDKDQGKYSNCLNDQRSCWESKINQAKQKPTLSNQP